MTDHTIIKGNRLKKNQAVGVIAPGSPVSKSEIEKGLRLLESQHLKPILGKHLFDSAKYLAGYDIDRTSDLHHMFLDPDIKAIFCARGGYGTTRLLHMIDFDIIAQNPKIIVGFSDITALLFAIYKKTGLITIHGPTLSQLSKNNNLAPLLKLITTTYRPEITIKKGRVIKSGQAKGIILGGNLSIICSLCGTSFLPPLKNKILFIEEKGESPYRIDRMLTQLLLTNTLKELSAIIIGQIDDCGEKDTIEAIFEERLSGLTIPIISGLPVGHGEKNTSLPLGLPALLDTDNMVLKIEESAVS
jgi:muramoyltetrapeptide carboxypeptidase